MEIEVYNCGCKVRIYEVEYGESKTTLPSDPASSQITALAPSTGTLEEFRLKKLVS